MRRENPRHIDIKLLILNHVLDAGPLLLVINSRRNRFALLGLNVEIRLPVGHVEGARNGVEFIIFSLRCSLIVLLSGWIKTIYSGFLHGFYK